MQQYINSLANQANGLPISGATVTVLKYPSLSVATIYGVNSTATSIPGNAVITDSNGGYSFYAPDGHYSLRMSGVGITPLSIDDILLEDVADKDNANFAALTADSLVVGGESVVLPSTLSPSSGSSLVGFIQAGTGAVAETVQSKLREMISVIDFGADPTGIADSTTAIQDAVNSLSSGGIVYLPKGNYLISSPITCIAGVSFKGDGKQASKLFTNASIICLSFSNINCYGIFVEDLWIYGNAGSIGIYVGTTTEESSHMRFSDLRIDNHAIGITGVTATYGLFDSLLEKVDFINCSGSGAVFQGSQITCIECHFRLCAYGCKIQYLNAGSIGGVKFFGCTWISNTYDVVFSGTTIRSCSWDGCWFEQCVTAVLGTLTSPTQFFLSLNFKSCVFQPSATSAGGGVVLLNNVTGSLQFIGCAIYKDLYASSTIPEASDAHFGSSTLYSRQCCFIVTGTTVTPLSDCYSNYTINLVNVMNHRQYANDADAGTAGLVQGDVYYNTAIPCLSLKN